MSKKLSKKMATRKAKFEEKWESDRPIDDTTTVRKRNLDKITDDMPRIE